MRDGQTATRIAEAARDILDREGHNAVTVRRVAGAVGITPMAVYRHYPNHQGLLSALADEGFIELAARLSTLPLAGETEVALTRVLDAYLDFGFENPRLFELMFLQRREGARQFPKDFRARKSPTANLFSDVIRRGMDDGYFREDDCWEITFEMGALLQGLIMLFIGGRVGMSRPQFRRYCQRAFQRYLNGIRR
ncbi:MAG TPA: TetR/AcrR family transcriptional regulator [Bryobacteraceae bacterium]|nr:TetR/AcrR family transcriptional regulator [Bryobacteraceae bacterium]